MKLLYKVLILAVIVLVILGIVHRSMNSHIPSIAPATTERGGAIPVFPANPDGIITINDSLRFRFDTGSSASTLIKDDARRLRNMGIDVEVRKFPVVSRTTLDEKFYIAKGTVITKIPYYYMRHIKDSAHHGHYESTGKIAGYIENLAFLPAPETDTISTLGIDMIEHFIVEMSKANKAITLRTSVPDDYQYEMDLKRPISLFGLISDSHRYYMPLRVQNHAATYRIDTGIALSQLKMPAADSLQVHIKLQDVMLSTPRGVAPAKYADSVWVGLGNRQGSYSAHYTDEGEDDYAINPLNFFKQDVVFDFPGKKFYMHPISNLITPSK